MATETTPAGTATGLVPQASQLEEKFNGLAQQWYRETGMISILHRKTMHPAYQRIIGMGQDALPFVFRELKKSKGHWLWALCAITGEDPAESSQSFNEAVDAWLQWGGRHGYI